MTEIFFSTFQETFKKHRARGKIQFCLFPSLLWCVHVRAGQTILLCLINQDIILVGIGSSPYLGFQLLSPFLLFHLTVSWLKGMMPLETENEFVMLVLWRAWPRLSCKKTVGRHGTMYVSWTLANLWRVQSKESVSEHLPYKEAG